MRIFQVLEGSSNAAVPGSQTWHRNLYEPLVEMGHEVVLFSAAEGRLAMQHNDSEARARYSQTLLDAFRFEHSKRPFTLFFAYLMDGMVEPAAIDEIRKTGVPTCNFSCNNAHQFYLVDELSPHFDYNLHSEKDARGKFLSIGANPIWFPMAANPKYYHPIDIDKTIDVSFVGASYAKRSRYIWNLLENGMNVHVYGPGWRSKEGMTFLRSVKRECNRSLDLLQSIFTFSTTKRAANTSRIADLDFQQMLKSKYNQYLHFPISDEEMIIKYSESKIILGFLEVFNNHDSSKKSIQHVHLREFEAPMCRAFYLTNYSEELAEFYKPDREVAVFRNEHELLDKVIYYLNHPNEAEKIRQAGYRRASECHTYQKRYLDLFHQFKLES